MRVHDFPATVLRSDGCDFRARRSDGDVEAVARSNRGRSRYRARRNGHARVEHDLDACDARPNRAVDELAACASTGAEAVDHGRDRLAGCERAASDRHRRDGAGVLLLNAEAAIAAVERERPVDPARRAAAISTFAPIRCGLLCGSSSDEPLPAAIGIATTVARIAAAVKAVTVIRDLRMLFI